MNVPEWTGECPYFLLFVPASREPQLDHITIDLDEPSWLSRYGYIFRTEGEMFLIQKLTERVLLSVRLNEGDQGYYVARHVGIASGANPVKNEVVAYGIGKKRADGNQDNLWYLPWGQVCGGNDVEYFALQGLRKGLG